MTVDSLQQRKKMEPFHQVRSPKAFCVLDVSAVAPTARAIRRRIASTEASRGAGSYVYLDEKMRVFVITEDATCAQQWILDRFRWLVGFYSMTPQRFSMHATVAGLVEDIECHLQTLVRDSQLAGGGNSQQSATGDASLKRPVVPAGDIHTPGGGHEVSDE